MANNPKGNKAVVIILAFLAANIVLGVLLCAGVGYLFVSNRIPGFSFSPPLLEPGVVVGEDFLEWDTWYDNPMLGAAMLARDGDEGCVVADEHAAYFLDLEGNELQTVEFPGEAFQIGYVATLDDSVRGFLLIDRQLSGAPDAGVNAVLRFLDRDGQELWQYSAKSFAGARDVGDPDGDGQLDTVIACRDAIRLIGPTGEVRMAHPIRSPGNLDFADFTPDGLPEIVCRAGMAGGDDYREEDDQLLVVSADGKVLSRKAMTNDDWPNFCVVHWPDRSSPELLLVAVKDGLQILTPDGTVIQEYALPELDVSPYPGLIGVPVKLDRDRPAYFAVYLFYSFGGADGRVGILAVYDSENNLVYRENLLSSYIDMTAIADPETGAEALILSTVGGVERYTRAEPNRE